ncbi:MAG TPA: DUF559 domain-containing protein, partial [Thermoanaerobaculia bacterium]|nr:DUF559 domain-containing protein [Thermoanaerobaculia bacterium]
ELDGGEHSDPDKEKYDRNRTSELERMGFRELRFWNNAVLENLPGVLGIIEGALKASPAPSPAASPRPLPPGER